jgi:phosphoribosylaminoimidazole-succinocarboxamide synthase
MDKEPVRTYLSGSGWDKNSEPDPLPDEVVAETSRRYKEIYRRIVGATF